MSANNSTDYSVDLRELLEAGAHFGHQSRRWNPRMAPYIYTQRDGVHVFDLAITGKKLEAAMTFVRDWVKEGNEIVFVGTKRQAQAIVKEEAIKVGASFITERWLGGTLTNWDEISKRIAKLREMKEKREAGGYTGYTKKELVLIDKDIARLERFVGGLARLKGKPQALFVVDSVREKTAIAEANILNVPVVAMIDSNADPDTIQYEIPINDDAIRSIKLVVSKIGQAYADGKELREREGESKQG